MVWFVVHCCACICCSVVMFYSVVFGGCLVVGVYVCYWFVMLCCTVWFVVVLVLCTVCVRFRCVCLC